MFRPRIGIMLTIAPMMMVAAPALGQQPARPKGPAPAIAPAPKRPPAQTKAGGNESPPAALPPMTPQMEALLSAWEAKSRQITSLEADFERVDNFTLTTGQVEEYKGKAVLKSPNLAYLDFREFHRKTGKVDGITERIVCMGDKVLQYEAETKQILVWPLAADSKNKALEEGPLPFLFNMKAAEIKKRYALQLLPSPPPPPRESALPDRSDHYLIQIFPRLEIDRDAFQSAMILLDKKTFFPSDLKLILPNGQDTQWYSFPSPIRANPPVDPKQFDFVKYQGWDVLVNPGAAPAGGPAPKVAGPRPAAKGMVRPR